jgi:hypothetical protein
MEKSVFHKKVYFLCNFYTFLILFATIFWFVRSHAEQYWMSSISLHYSIFYYSTFLFSQTLSSLFHISFSFFVFFASFHSTLFNNPFRDSIYPSLTKDVALLMFVSLRISFFRWKNLPLFGWVYCKGVLESHWWSGNSRKKMRE